MKSVARVGAALLLVAASARAQCRQEPTRHRIDARSLRAAGAERAGIGTRVRLTAPSLRREPFVGRIEAFPGDSVSLDTSAVQRRISFDADPVLVDELRCVTLPRDAVTRIELSAGRSHLRSAAIGALTGGLGGGLFFGLMARNDQTGPTAPSFADGFVNGLVGGAVVGGVVGWLWGRERWVTGRWSR